MAELKPCPFCGGEPYIQNRPTERKTKIYSVKCSCGVMFKFKDRRYKAIEAWNRRTTVETNIYDKEETYPNCTVQVLTNTATGETSVGWWENGGKEDGK